MNSDEQSSEQASESRLSPQLTASDISQLDVLPLLYRIMAVLTFCFSSIFLIHLFIGLAGIVNPEAMRSEKGEPMPAFFFWMFALVGGGMVTLGWTFAGFVFKTADWIKERRRHTWITVIAALCCLQTPIGTALGVFTLVVILRPQVKALFAL